ncbi:MAG: family 20 glycosylhydrolase [Bacteroidota bacterium]
MKKKLILSIAVLISMILISCTVKHETLSIIPLPQSVKVGNGEFTITKETKLIYDNQLVNIQNVIDYFNGYLMSSSGFQLKTTDAKSVDGASISFKIDKSIENNEGYKLSIDKSGITISSSSSQGIFYGVQTILQLLPEDIYSKEIVDFSLNLPYCEIKDGPRFKWRGMHLDVGRHFFNTEFIKKYIDYIAMHKMNRFHWHLTEDQGWRIEIKKYPKLTKIGSVRKETTEDGTPHSGFYTQEEVKEIVEYASKRFITVVPEIEMPGHSTAALAAYPEYSCTGGPFEVATEWGVHKEIYCAGKEETFKFLENILTEVIPLFPGEYFHVGGDEAPKARWEKCKDCQARIKNEGLKDEHELQSYFIQRMEKFLNSKGKKLIGWDEILEGGLAPQATVMSWRGVKGGIEAAKSEHYAVMSPGSHCYFDHYQGLPENEPVAIGGYTTLSKVYSYEPIPEELSPKQHKYILGAQANVWTEHIPTPEHVEYMMTPRISAIAEVCWTNKELKNLDDFLSRMDKQFNRYSVAGINYAKSEYNVAIKNKFDAATKSMALELDSELPNLDIYYTLDGSDPDTNSIKYSKPFSINQNTNVKAVSYKNKKKMSNITTRNFQVHKAFGKEITVVNPYKEKYSAGGKYGLVNGLYGGSSHNSQWQGYEGVDFEAVLDLGESTEIKTIETKFIQKNKSWIYLPEFVEYSFSEDGKIYSGNIKIVNEIPKRKSGIVIEPFTVNPKNLSTRYIKVFAKNIGVNPDWHQSPGGKAWLFIDEITVK